MQHAIDNWATAAMVVILSLIILFKIEGAGERAKSIIPSTTLIWIFGILLSITVLTFVQSHGTHDKSALHAIYIEDCVGVAILILLAASPRGKVPTIRRIAGLNAIDEAVGRATELGRPVLMVPGIDGLGITSLQALNIFSHIARSVAKFGNRTILPVIDPPLVGIGEEVIREAYTHAGRPELFNPDDVRFLSDRQFSFAAGCAGLMEREKVAAVFLMGAFFAESLILAETGQRVGAIQVAATPMTTQLPFFIASCDYVLLGDEFYAASAYLSKNPTLLGSIVGQDYCKVGILLSIVLGTVAASMLAVSPHLQIAKELHGFIEWFTR